MKGFSFQFDAVGAVNDAVEDGITQDWIADDFVPAADGKQAGDQQGDLAVAIIYDLEQVTPLFGVQGLGSPITDDPQAAYSFPNNLCRFRNTTTRAFAPLSPHPPQGLTAKAKNP